MPSYAYADIKSEYQLSRDSGDPWGSLMTAWFGLAGELWMRGEAVPVEWNYSPGAAADPREPEDYMYDLYKDATTEALVRFGNVLERYARFVKRAGRDY